MTSTHPQLMPCATPPLLPESAQDEISLREIWQRLIDQKWWIVAITLLCTSGAITYALTATPIFQADVLLEPAGEDAKKGGGSLAQLGGLAAMAGISLGGSGGTKDMAIAKLKSRIFLEEFIRDENLLPVLFHEKWDSENKKWKPEDPKKIPTYFQGVDYFRTDILKVSEDKKTGLVTLILEWQDKEQTTRWANLLIERINRHLRTQAIEDAKRNIDYLNGELNKTTITELRQAISTILEDQIKKIMLANGRQDFAFRVIDPAVIPEKRTRPKRVIIVILGGITGLFLGMVTAFIRGSTLTNSKKN
ncbi:MAG: hypothetical protein G8237_08660 [Magnetococcales bacterium]|nr:hypothetical protein [Magnetococcales bacterium]